MILQAIVTKYIGPSNVKGSRVKATAQAGSITLHWDSALNSDLNHCRAALAMAAKMKWEGKYVGGGMPDGRVCFVNAGQGCIEPDFEVIRDTLFLRGRKATVAKNNKSSDWNISIV